MYLNIAVRIIKIADSISTTLLDIFLDEEKMKFYIGSRSMLKSGAGVRCWRSNPSLPSALHSFHFLCRVCPHRPTSHRGTYTGAGSRSQGRTSDQARCTDRCSCSRTEAVARSDPGRSKFSQDTVTVLQGPSECNYRAAYIARPRYWQI